MPSPTELLKFQTPRRRGQTQRGAVMVFSLIVLVAITVFVLSMVNTSSSQFIVVGNMQQKRRLDDVAREAIEMTINSGLQFTNTIAGSATVQNYTSTNSPGTFPYNYNVTVTLPYCYGTKNPPGYSALSAVAPEDTHWVITSTATDPATGSVSVVEQGIKIRLGSGNCGII